MTLVWAAVAHAAPEAITDRTFGLGVGSSLSATASGLPPLDQYSVRLQFDRVAIEPRVTALAGGATDGATDAELSFTTLGAGVDVRGYVACRHPVLLVVSGGVAATRDTSTERLGGDDTTTRGVGADVHAGVGLEWASSERWSFGIDLIEPLASTSHTELRGSGAPVEVSSWGVGLAPPRVTVMGHLYF